MQRWKITVLLGIFIGVLIISCMVLFLQNGEGFDADGNVIDRNSDLPFHPISKSTQRRSSSNQFHQSHQKSAENHHNHHHQHEEDDNAQEEENTYRHNYRKRFSDAIKGVFKDLLNSKNSSTVNNNNSHPSPSTPPSSAQKESSENNSSRLKRQLDFGSASDETTAGDGEQQRRTTKPVSSSSRRPIIKFTTRRPIIKILKIGGTGGGSTEFATAPSTAVENSDENKIENSSEGKRFSKGGTRQFKPKLKPLSLPPQDRYDDDDDDDDESTEDHNMNEHNPKNFTYEVVQVERKVVRKEDGHIPAYFTKEVKSFNIEPRLSKVEKKETSNSRPAQLLYRKNWSPEQGPRPRGPLNVNGRPATAAADRISTESSTLSKDDSQEKKVVVNLQVVPYNTDREVSEEDLKDYHDGHSTFGSKGNFKHTIISRNVAGFLPNQNNPQTNSPPPSENDGLRKRSGGTGSPNGRSTTTPNTSGDKQFIIAKGKVTERTLQRDLFRDSPEELEIYTVPGGRTSSTETSTSAESPRHEAFRFNQNHQGRRPERQRGDLTSPEVPSSFEDLFRKGHPGVVRPPPPNNTPLTHRRHNIADDEPYGDSADYGHPFPYNPLVDDPPLKFDPESDRFYGSPILDKKEKLAQPNSPAKVENDPSREQTSREYNNNDPYNKPRGRSEDIEENDDESSTQISAESPQPPPQPPRNNNPNPADDRFYYGRTYNPPDYSSPDYDTAGNDKNGERDSDIYDFVGLDENFERQNNEADDGPPDDFFDFPEGEREFAGGFRPARNDERSREVNSEEQDFHDRTTQVERNTPPPSLGKQPPPRGNSPPEDYDGGSPENDYGGFGSGSRVDGANRRGGNIRNSDGDDEDPELYDSAFVQTLKQFDEEIKKLQDEERKKLLHAAPVPSSQQNPVGPLSTTSGYNKKEPPLIITSPGPLEGSHENSSPPGSHEVGASVGVTENDQGPPPTSPNDDESSETSGEDANNNAANDNEEDEEEEGDGTNNRSVGGTESSEGRSEEEDPDKKKKRK